MLQWARVLVRKLGGPAAVLTLAALVGLLGLLGCLAGNRARATYHLQQAEKALREERIDAVRTHLARSLNARPGSADIHFRAGRLARQAGETEDAKQFLQRSRALGWPEDRVLFEEGLLAAQRDPRPFASYLLARAQETPPDRDLILEALSRGYLNLFDLPRALHCLDLWLEKSPDALRARMWRADAQERLAHYEKAQADLQHAVALEPGYLAARTQLARLLLRGRKLEAASSHFEIAHQQCPEDVEVLRGLASCRQEQNRREEAERLLDQALALQPDDVPTLTQRGNLALEAGQVEKAERWLRRAVTLAPFEREPLFNYSRCLQAGGKPEEARVWEERLAKVEADLKRVKQLMAQVLASSADPVPRYEVGVIFLRNQQEREGLRWLQSALQCDPRHRPTHQALANHFEEQGETEQAAQHRKLSGSPE